MIRPTRLFKAVFSRNRKSRARRRAASGRFDSGEQLESRTLLSAVYGDFNGDGFDDLAAGVAAEDVGKIQDAGAVNVIYGSAYGLSATAGPGDQLLHQDVYGIDDRAEARDRFGAALAAGDFNADGYVDLAIGVPGEDIGTIQDAGAVNVIYGSPKGLRYNSSSVDQLWHQNSKGIEGGAERDDRFGSALAAGDFNGDGVADLAIGAWGEDIGSIKNAGSVNIIYGRAGYGLTANGDQIWHQNSYGINDVSEANDRFGASLAAGDFDGNGSDDLAIGVPGEDIGSVIDAGAVNVIYGIAGTGLRYHGDQFLHQNTRGIVDVAETADGFGSALAVGDFNKSGAKDLAIGVPGENIGSILDAGAVNVIYGTPGSGLTDYANQFWHQNSYSILDTSETDDGFGTSLAAGDFNNNGSDDLAVGVPGENLGSVVDAGAVNVIYGDSRSGLSGSGDQFWHQNSYGIAESAERNDRFGASLAVGNFGRDSRADLAIGVGGEDIGLAADAGAVNVIYGRYSTGLNSGYDQFFSQNTNNIAGVSEKSDGFGATLVPQKFDAFWITDASGDDTSTKVFAEGAMRLTYDFDNAAEAFDGVWLEALDGDDVVASWGRLFRLGESNLLIDMAGRGLTAGEYQFRAKAVMRDGSEVYSLRQDIEILSDTTFRGSFRGESFDYQAMIGTGTILVGAGGTDTLDLGVSSTMVSSFNGGSLNSFDSLAGAMTSLAVYRGTTFDFLSLTNGREIYFQGIEKLVFSDGVEVDLQIQTDDPSFSDQWNLHVADVGSAWRFTQGSQDVLLVSLDSGLLTPEGGTGDVYDMTEDRLIVDDSDDDNFFGTFSYGHGHKAISVMSATPDNADGIAGINWNSDVMVADVYKASSGSGVYLQAAIEDALEYARDNGLRIVFQGGIQGESWLNHGGTQEELEALIYDNRDISLYAVAAGNGNVDIDETNPAGTNNTGGVARLQTDHGNVIAVGALERTSETVDGLRNASAVNRASYSNYGASLTLMAATDSPAVTKNNTISDFNGTSAANPNMAAIASLVWSVNPDFSGADVRQILIETAMDLETVGHDDGTGRGLVNAEAAVRRAMAWTRDYELARAVTSETIAAFYVGSTAGAALDPGIIIGTGYGPSPHPPELPSTEPVADVEAQVVVADETVNVDFMNFASASIDNAKTTINDANVEKQLVQFKQNRGAAMTVVKRSRADMSSFDASSKFRGTHIDAETVDGKSVDNLFSDFNDSLLGELLNAQSLTEST